MIVAFQMLNLSIDVPVAESKNSDAKDFNFIDNYVEFISVIIFKYENSIPLPSHRHHRELQTHPQVQVICEQVTKIYSAGFALSSQVKGYPGYLNNYSFRFIKDFNHPPSFS